MYVHISTIRIQLFWPSKIYLECSPRVIIVLSMPLHRLPASRLGTVQCIPRSSTCRFRMVATIEKVLIYGPYRECRRDAEADLKRAREAQTREEYRDNVRQLQKTSTFRKAKAKAKATRDGLQRLIRRIVSIRRYNNGWRVAAAPTGDFIHGPFRVTKRQARGDLEKARRAQTPEEYCEILRQLKKAVRLS